jgi:hypothetical protein
VNPASHRIALTGMPDDLREPAGLGLADGLPAEKLDPAR